MVVGFIGSGNMAAGMARGWKAAEAAGPEKMLFTDSGSGRAASLAAEVGGEAVATNEELVSRSDVVVLALKPAGLMLAAEAAKQGEVVISMLGATSEQKLREAMPDVDVFRLMPNLGVEKGRGTLCLSHHDSIEASQVEKVTSLLSLLGKVVEMADEDMDAATAVMGCTPAYFALAAEAIAEAGAKDGLDPRLALSLVVESMAGAAELLGSYSPGALREAVASPGGSTEAGLIALDEQGAADAFRAAVEASLDRMRGT